MIIANKSLGILVIDPIRILINQTNNNILARQIGYQDAAILAHCSTKEIAITLFNKLLKLMQHYTYIVIDGDEIVYYGNRRRRFETTPDVCGDVE